MFGVGLNPVYMQRVEERDKKRRESGDLALEEFDRAAQEKLNVLFDPTAAPLQPVAKAAAKAAAKAVVMVTASRATLCTSKRISC